MLIRPRERRRDRQLTPQRVGDGSDDVERAPVSAVGGVARALRLRPRARGVPVAHLHARVPDRAVPAPQVVPLEVLQVPLVEPRDEGEGVDPPRGLVAEDGVWGFDPDAPRRAADESIGPGGVDAVRDDGHDVHARGGHEGVLVRGARAHERHGVERGAVDRARRARGGEVGPAGGAARLEIQVPRADVAAGVVRDAEREPVALRDRALGRARVVRARGRRGPGEEEEEGEEGEEGEQLARSADGAINAATVRLLTRLGCEVVVAVLGQV